MYYHCTIETAVPSKYFEVRWKVARKGHNRSSNLKCVSGFALQYQWSDLLAGKVQTGMYRGADKSLARPTSRCILFDGENISFDASLVIYINSTNISPIMIINRIYENQNLLSL